MKTPSVVPGIAVEAPGRGFTCADVRKLLKSVADELPADGRPCESYTVSCAPAWDKRKGQNPVCVGGDFTLEAQLGSMRLRLEVRNMGQEEETEQTNGEEE